ncbi:putative ATP-dependent RNA helicase TDRD12 isoform X2 [Odontomachus brunneus]|nr:putative ATP-dependent RNA helicase TDRD12 isoform X2 [Odontomachus brunneus]XP_032684021.1 putative ATP-dependent RNA helicase TDRD12 isoform X2 [Odontomachus brunneus]XP_032684022.1 putative ATP-dependent RNA helicase TDRD12 isoform X2 [Odontomachus brunneus]
MEKSMMNCPLLVSNFHTPRIIWSQSDLTIVVRILLIDVHHYYLRVESDYLLFSTTVNDKNYYLTLHLFGPVIAEKTVHNNFGREIKISLTKGLKWFQWLRLISSKEKDPLITYDLNYICEKKYIKKNFFIKGSVNNIKQQYDKMYIRPPTDDESESESDEELDFLKYA